MSSPLTESTRLPPLWPFGLLCAVLLLDAYQPGRQGNGFLPVAGAVVLGLVLAGTCISSRVNAKEDIFESIKSFFGKGK